MRGKKKEGRPLSLDEHHNKLKSLGLSDEDLREFDEDFKGNTSKKNKNKE